MLPVNQPLSFQALTEAITNSECWVSIKCYLPAWFALDWLPVHLANHPNLILYLRTVVISAERDETGALTSVQAIQRTPRTPGDDWSELLSASLPDWYSANDSARFTKQILNFTSSVFIEATE